MTYWLYAGAWAVVRRLPERVAYRLFDLVADLVWWRQVAAVRRLEANLRRARPAATPAELRALSRAGMRSYLRYWCDAFRLPDWSRDRVVGSVRVVGEEHLRSSTGEGARGVVGALLHMGNWDHAGAWASLTGVPVVTVAERLQPERLYERFLAYREGLGMEILPLTGGDRDLVDVLARRLRAGRLVPLLADRDLRASGVPERSIIWKHALRNAALPVVTVLGLVMIGAISGTVFVEHEHALVARRGRVDAIERVRRAVDCAIEAECKRRRQ